MGCEKVAALQIERACQNPMRSQHRHGKQGRQRLGAAPITDRGEQDLAEPSGIEQPHSGDHGRERIFGRQSLIGQNPLAISCLAPKLARCQRQSVQPAEKAAPKDGNQHMPRREMPRADRIRRTWVGRRCLHLLIVIQTGGV